MTLSSCFSKKGLFTAMLVVVMGFAVMSLIPAEAQANCNGYDPRDPYGLNCGANSGLSGSDPRLIVARIINITLSVLGVISVSIIVFAGFKWMTSGGNEEQVKGAQRMLVASIIGLAIILSAYAISVFVLTKLNQATQLNPDYYTE